MHCVALQQRESIFDGHYRAAAPDATACNAGGASRHARGPEVAVPNPWRAFGRAARQQSTRSGSRSKWRVDDGTASAGSAESGGGVIMTRGAWGGGWIRAIGN